MYREVLLPVDLSESDSWDRALPAAVDLCQAFGARLHVLTVVPVKLAIVESIYPEDFEERLLGDVTKQLNALVDQHVPDGIKARPVVAQGAVYKVIIDTADGIEADVIVMGSHRSELDEYLLGPNAARVVRHSSRSVLIVR